MKNDNRIEYYTDPTNGTSHTIVKYKGERTRLRSELLIVKDGAVLLSHEQDETLSVPGGGIEKGENPVKAAIREAQEEVKITAKNVTQSSYSYASDDNVIRPWVKEHVPEDKQWLYYYTYICVGEFDSEFNGEIAKADQDKNMLENARWFPIENAIYFPTFREEWRHALEDAGYLEKNNEPDRISDVTDQIKDIKYGFKSKVDGKDILDRDWIHNCKNLDKYYDVQTDPEKTLNDKLGICQDQAIVIKYLMNKLHPEDEVKLYALMKKPKGHCIACYCHNNKWYYLENAWDKEKGLHGPWDSEDELKTWLKNMYLYHHQNDTPKENEVTLDNYVISLQEEYKYTYDTIFVYVTNRHDGGGWNQELKVINNSISDTIKQYKSQLGYGYWVEYQGPGKKHPTHGVQQLNLFDEVD